MEAIWFQVFTVIIFMYGLGYGHNQELSNSSTPSFTRVYRSTLENIYGNTTNIFNETISESQVEGEVTTKSRNNVAIKRRETGIMNIENVSTASGKVSLDVLNTTNSSEISMKNGIYIIKNGSLKSLNPSDMKMSLTSETYLMESCFPCNSSVLLDKPAVLTKPNRYIGKNPLLSDDDSMQNKSKQIAAANYDFEKTRSDNNLKRINSSGIEQSYEYDRGFDPYFAHVSNVNRKTFEEKLSKLTSQAEKYLDAELKEVFNSAKLKSLSLDSLLQLQEQAMNSTVKIFDAVENIIQSLCLEVGDKSCFMATHFRDIEQRFVNCSLSPAECDILFENLTENSPLYFKVLFDTLEQNGHGNSVNTSNAEEKNTPQRLQPSSENAEDVNMNITFILPLNVTNKNADENDLKTKSFTIQTVNSNRSQNYSSYSSKNTTGTYDKGSLTIINKHSFSKNSANKNKKIKKQFRRSVSLSREDILPSTLFAALHYSSTNPDKFHYDAVSEVIPEKKFQDYDLKTNTENQLQPDLNEVTTEKKFKIVKRQDPPPEEGTTPEGGTTPAEGGDPDKPTVIETTTQTTEITPTFYLLSVTLPSFVGIALSILCICYFLRTGGWCCNLFLEDQEALKDQISKNDIDEQV